MTVRLREVTAPVYLTLCLLLGGSAQDVWGNLFLQLSGTIILVWAFWPSGEAVTSRAARMLGWLGLAAALLVLVQLVPLPPNLWTLLPGRAAAVEGYRLLGQPLPWLPLSLTPYETLAAIPPLIPPAAILAAILRQSAYRSAWLASAIVVGALLSILLGALQLTGGGYYLYPHSSLGSATGFFANGNFLGTLLLAAIPFLVALVVQSRGRRGPGMALAAGPLLVLLVGLAISRSLAALLLTLPVVLASLVLFAGSKGRGLRWVGLVAAGVGMVALLGFARLPALSDPNNAVSTATREHIYSNTARAIGDMFPLGSGAGSFPRIFALYEQLTSYQGAYVNHAHSDYLEVALEFGLPGIILLALFLWWWGNRTLAIWRSPASGRYARGATIASAAILAHSLVDFPVRNAAIAGVLATSLALMAEPRRRNMTRETVDQRPARHLSL